MNAPLTDAISAFCGNHGIRAPIAVQPVRAGRNSRVSRVVTADGQWLLKEYGPTSFGREDEHDRLSTEFAFLKYLENANLTDVARPIGMDRALACALYSWRPGARPSHVSADHVRQAAKFIAAVNRNAMTSEARDLAAAADACKTTDDHLDLTRRRLTHLTAIEPTTSVEKRALALVVDHYLPAWRAIEKHATATLAASRRAAQILSPSDFGFHNSLLHEGRLSFVDFEYAGWDDPVKLICDFICQPELPVTTSQATQFIDEMAMALPQNGDLHRWVEVLLPAHRLKWCCILLNEFCPAYRRRRLHARISGKGLLKEQLHKAERYFAEHMSGCTSRSSSAIPLQIHTQNVRGEP